MVISLELVVVVVVVVVLLFGLLVSLETEASVILCSGERPSGMGESLGRVGGRERGEGREGKRGF